MKWPVDGTPPVFDRTGDGNEVEAIAECVDTKRRLWVNPRCWLVTGGSGIHRSNLLESLLRLNQEVLGLDTYSSGHRRNIEDPV